MSAFDPAKLTSIYAALRTELLAQLPSYLSNQRWFGGKAREIRSTELLDLIPLRGLAPGAVVLLARIEYSDGPSETYVLPGLSVPEPAEGNAANLESGSAGRDPMAILSDALEGEDFAQAVLDAIGRQSISQGVHGVIRAVSTDRFLQLRPDAREHLVPRMSKGEQSNTSILYGNRFILKLFRRPEAGVNLDLEIGRFLSEKARFPHVPPVAGYLQYEKERGESMTLGILQEFVPNQGDAWQFTQQALSGFWDDVSRPRQETLGRIPVMPPESTVDFSPAASERIGPYLEAVGLLGKRTAELHFALASERRDPAFAPEPFSPDNQRQFEESARCMTEQTLALLKRRMHELPPTLHGQAENVLGRQGDIERRFHLALDTPLKSMRTRIHGDYHLGQVLYTGSDFVIIDFEGEPARPLAERRLKRSPLQDVAGMLRSFHYAAFARLLAPTEGGFGPTDNPGSSLAWAESWYASVSDQFLKSYLESSRTADYLPPTAEEISTLLGIHLLEKSIYELGYELNNRPMWAGIPMAGILNSLAR